MKMSQYAEIEEFYKGSKRNAQQNNGTPSRADSFIEFSDKGIDNLSIPFGVFEGGENESAYNGRIISVKLGECTKMIGIDGSYESINEAIRAAFRIQTERTFWLEDENKVIRSIDREMPLGSYDLHLDKGVTIKICLYDEPDHSPVRAEEKTFYSEDHLHKFLGRHGWIALKDISCSKTVHTIDELHPDEMHHGLRMLGN